jgi:hypothetical protein
MMVILSYIYRFVSNFLLLALVYFSLNFLEKYQQRAIVAMIVLAYVLMRTASALRSFYFYQRIERLEMETRRLANIHKDASRRHIIGEVTALRQNGEVKAYIELMFLCLIVLLCLVKLVSD